MRGEALLGYIPARNHHHRVYPNPDPEYGSVLVCKGCQGLMGEFRTYQEAEMAKYRSPTNGFRQLFALWKL
ncbi:hypothetical protein CDL15_Pgr003976 [Punica granatum]|uniref:Uncharacterized protein n=1 Tax=Punica granatum TaxID=22663 RepID=A0A218WPE7_PUNGR|nr:hypothetical protein CDL15_Pgr003976 [Punica granatum]